MANKTYDDDFFGNANIAIPEEPKHEEEKIKEEPVKPMSAKNPMKVINIIGKEVVLEDKHGNGIRIPIPQGYPKLKIGDTIYL